MASEKELEIKLKATGGAQAAAEVEKVEDAVKGLGDTTDQKAAPATEALADALGDMSAPAGAAGAGVEAVSDAVGDMVPSMGGGIDASHMLSGAMGGLATGGLQLAADAVIALVSYGLELEAELDAIAASTADLHAKNAALATELDALLDPLANVTAATDSHTQAVLDLIDADDAYAAGVDARVAAIDREREAQDNLKKAIIDKQVAEGTMTPEAAAREKGELDKSAATDAAEREAKAAAEKVASANKAIADAEAESRRNQAAADAEIEKVTAERIAVAKMAEDAKRAAEAKARQAESKAQEGAYDQDAALPFLFDPTSLAADYLLRKKAQKDAAAKSKAEADKASADAEKLKEQSAEVNDKEKEVRAARIKDAAAEKAAIDAKKRDRDKAAADAVKANQQKDIVTKYDNPAIDAGLDARDATAASKAKALADKAAEATARKAAKEAERAAAAQQDSEAKTLAGEIQSKVASAPNAAADTGLLDALKGIASTLGNGTDSAELAGISNQLITLVSNLSAEQTASRALIANLKSRIDGMR